MRKRSLVVIKLLVFCFTSTVLLANLLAASGIGIRPDFYAYPFYKSSVKIEESQLKKYVEEICAKEQCQNQYLVKVFKWSIWRYDVAYLVQKQRIIFIKHGFIKNFNENEKKFILSHEMGHQILSTVDEMEVDSFAVKYSNTKTAIETLKKTSFLTKLKENTPIQIDLQKRIKALKK